MCLSSFVSHLYCPFFSYFLRYKTFQSFPCPLDSQQRFQGHKQSMLANQHLQHRPSYSAQAKTEAQMKIIHTTPCPRGGQHTLEKRFSAVEMAKFRFVYFFFCCLCLWSPWQLKIEVPQISFSPGYFLDKPFAQSCVCLHMLNFPGIW